MTLELHGYDDHRDLIAIFDCLMDHFQSSTMHDMRHILEGMYVPGIVYLEVVLLKMTKNQEIVFFNSCVLDDTG